MHTQVIDAFQMPRHEWEPSHKRFVRCSKPPSIHAEPLSKPKVVLGRLQMLEQCVQRITQFSAGSRGAPEFHVRHPPRNSSRDSALYVELKCFLVRTVVCELYR